MGKIFFFYCWAPQQINHLRCITFLGPFPQNKSKAMHKKNVVVVFGQIIGLPRSWKVKTISWEIWFPWRINGPPIPGPILWSILVTNPHRAFIVQVYKYRHSVWKSQQKSHSTSRAKRVTFKFSREKSS